MAERGTPKCASRFKDLVRLQQGMTFKYAKKDGKFIHTWCDGELHYRSGYTFEDVVRKEWHAFLSKGEIQQKLWDYKRARHGGRRRCRLRKRKKRDLVSNHIDQTGWGSG